MEIDRAGKYMHRLEPIGTIGTIETIETIETIGIGTIFGAIYMCAL